MSQINDNQLAQLDNQLDRSVQQDYPESYNRNSGIQQLQLEQDESNHNHQNFDESQHKNNFARESQFQEQGVFSYEEDYRMRQSMKSQQDFQLEDVSGNADMSDRKIQIPVTSSQDIKIVQQYHQQLDLNEQTVQNNSPASLQKQKQQPTEISKQAQSPQTVEKAIQLLNEVKQQNPVVKQNQIQDTASFKQTPKKQQQKSSTSQKQKKQQWSIQSNKSYSPMPQQDIYQSPKKKNQQKQQKKVQETEKPKISLIKETFSLFKQAQPAAQNQNKSSGGGGIRDWFKLSGSKQSTIAVEKNQPTVSNKNTQGQKQQQQTKSKQEDAKQKYRKQMQAQMLGFQQSLSKHQKANKIFGTTDKQKQKHKMNKTHLPQPSNKIFYGNQDTDSINKDEYKMLLKISFEKKKQNYQMLKQWDKNRAQNMNIHKNMIQMLQNQVDKRIKLSLENFQIYTNFFKQKLKQQQKFVNSPVINTKYALQNNSISKNIYINCSVILNSLSQQNQSKCKKVQDFITLIKNNILKDLADKHLHQSQKQLLKVRQKISTLKSSLKKYNTETEEKSQALATLFVQSSNNVSIKAQNDFYSVQLQFLRCAGQQVLIQKRLGQNCLQYYHTALSQQLKRAKIIKQALLTYSKGLKQTYGTIIEQAELQQLSKDEQIKLIEQFYSVEDMFDQRSSLLLKNKFKLSQSSDLTITQVAKFVQSFEFQNFNSRMLTLKQFHARYFPVGSGSNSNSKDPNKINRQQICYMVITVDFFIHLFFSADKSAMNFKPDVSLKIITKQLEIKEQKQEFIDIVKKQQKRGSMISYFWDTKNQKSYRVKFSSKDAKEQFCDYVRKLMF